MTDLFIDFFEVPTKLSFGLAPLSPSTKEVLCYCELVDLNLESNTLTTLDLVGSMNDYGDITEVEKDYSDSSS
jgi:hypothetical protein